MASLVVDDDIDLLSGMWDDDGYVFEALAGSDYGSPQPVEVILASFLRDGAIVSRAGDDNRTLTIPVRVRATDVAALNRGEQRMALLQNKPTTLAYTPSDGFGPTTVFQVWTSSLEQPPGEYNDLGELRNHRTYTWRFVCAPFSRSADATTIGSAFVAESITVADDCESTAGWSMWGSGYSGTFTVDSTAGYFMSGTGAVKLVSEPYDFDAPGHVTSNIAFNRTKVAKSLSIDASGGGYFIVRIRPEAGWSLGLNHAYLTTSGGGREEAPVVAITTEDNGFLRHAILVPNASTITLVEFDVTQNRSDLSWGSQPPNPPFWFDAIGLAGGATESQAVRTVEVGGSVRCEGSWEISAPVGLGDVLFYTAKDRGDGFRPDVRRHQTAGTSTAAAAAINGSYVQANEAQFEVPTSTLRAGTYAVLARVRASGSTTPSLTITAQTVLGGVAIGATVSTSTVGATVPDTTNYYIINAGTLDLPPHRVDAAANAVVRFITSGASTLRIDEVMIFPMEDAALTWLECGAGTPSATVASRVWIDGPSVDLPRGQILAGTDVTRSDARYIKPKGGARGRHMLYPGQMLGYLMTSAAGGASLSGQYFKHWHTWAAE